MKRKLISVTVILIALITSSFDHRKVGEQTTNDSIAMKLNDFASFRLTSDLSKLSDNERKMIPLLIQAADIMNEIFWLESYGNKDTLFEKLKDENSRKLASIHYGPWDRMNGNALLFEGFGNKRPGANFYPPDMTTEEFEKMEDSAKNDLYTLLRRDKQGKLITVPYHQAFSEQVEKASSLILQASRLAEDRGLKKYLELRSRALLTDNYRESDMAWMDMKTNRIDFIAGPIET